MKLRHCSTGYCTSSRPSISAKNQTRWQRESPPTLWMPIVSRGSLMTCDEAKECPESGKAQRAKELKKVREIADTPLNDPDV